MFSFEKREACKFADKVNYAVIYNKNNTCISCVFNGVSTTKQPKVIVSSQKIKLISTMQLNARTHARTHVSLSGSTFHTYSATSCTVSDGSRTAGKPYTVTKSDETATRN